jgi:HlyD family secretion protein
MKSRKNLWIITALLLTVLTGAALSGCGLLNAQGQAAPTPVPTVANTNKVTAEGRIVPKEYTYLSFPVNGEVSEVLAAQGAEVKKGDVLARLGKREQFQAALTQAKLEQLNAQQALDLLNRKADLAGGEAFTALVAANKALSEAQKVFDDLDTEDFRTKLDDKDAAVQKAKDKLKDANDELDKYLNLDKENQNRKTAQKAKDDAQKVYNDAIYDRDQQQYQLDQARSGLDLAKARQADAQKEYDNRKGGPDPDDLALAKARLDNAGAQAAAAQRALDNMDLTAPYAGNVLDLQHLVPGVPVTPGKTVITFADVSAWYMETKDLTELDVARLKTGQKVNAAADALPDVTLTGTIESISTVYSERSGDVLYTVRILIDEKPENVELRWGMTVKITFVDKAN